MWQSVNQLRRSENEGVDSVSQMPSLAESAPSVHLERRPPPALRIHALCDAVEQMPRLPRAVLPQRAHRLRTADEWNL